MPFSAFKRFLPGLLAVISVLPFHQAWSNDKPQYERIISLAPHITEHIYSAGAGSKLVGVVQYSDYPAEALKLPIIGSYTGINIEAILALKPDVVMVWQEGNSAKDIERLRQFGINVWQTDLKNISEIPQQIRDFGQAFGTKEQANRTARQLEAELLKITKRYQQRATVSAFYQVWNKPLITINGQQFISQAMQMCGAKNIFHELPLLASEVNLESIISRNPQIILLGGEKANQQAWFNEWQNWSNITAVKNGDVYMLNADLYQRPTERFIMALDELCQTIDKAR